MNILSAENAVQLIRSNDHIYIHTAAAAPQQLVKAMTARHHELKNVNIYHLHTEGVAPYTQREYRENFNTFAFFTAKNVRQAMKEGDADYVPIFLSEVPLLFRRRIIELDVAMIQVSPPDKHGYCSLGVSVDATRAAIQNATTVIAQINPNMPRTHGDGLIHVRNINVALEVNDTIYEHAQQPLSDVEKQIGENCAELIEDGATLQMGIGSIPDAVLAALGDHQDLGIHTEMFSDGVIPLIKSGVVNNSKKRIHPDKVVATFAMGTRALYDYMDDNPLIQMLDTSYVNDTAVIRRNPKVTAINSAIEVDFTGQVCADSIGTYQFSGVGGQMDFIRGASLSEGGKPIIALPSQTAKGVSKIVPYLKQGAGVVTTRAHVHYVVTEHGVANLFGKSLRQRTRALIDIAHPDHREELEKAAFERFNVL